MKSLNRVTLLGYVGKDPDIKSTKNGKEIASFSLATTSSWQDKSSKEWKNERQWHTIIVLVDQLSQLIKSFLRKGSQVYVEGELKTREWTDQSGNKKLITEIHILPLSGKIIILDQKEKDTKSTKNTSFEYDDGIPF